MKTQWTGRVVTDTRGAIILSDESTAYEDLKDWPHDIDDDEAECLSEHLTAPVLTDVEIAADCLYAAAYEN